ncbi:MAG: hypothetical protein HQL11_01360 [Candidatus Omnitrophica bacterium]|nr:hypothetical protein [Candidatus Omnitrophota bacterium]
MKNSISYQTSDQILKRVKTRLSEAEKIANEMETRELAEKVFGAPPPNPDSLPRVIRNAESDTRRRKFFKYLPECMAVLTAAVTLAAIWVIGSALLRR